jgi:hypothetical protein
LCETADSFTKASTAASDGFDVKYTYDFTDDSPGMKGAGTLKNFNGRQVFFRGNPGLSPESFTLSCERVITGVPGQLAVMAIYTDDTPEDYPGPVAKDHGCSTITMDSHSTLSCCLPAMPSPAGADISLKHSDCGGLFKHAQIVDFGPAAVARGKKTTMVAHGNNLDMYVYSANFELTMTGAHGLMVKCTGDASQTKSCPLPKGLGSLTMHGMSIPLQPSYVQTTTMNIDIYLNETMPKDLLTTTTVLRIYDNKPQWADQAEVLCLKIESAPTATSNTEVVV